MTRRKLFLTAISTSVLLAAGWFLTVGSAPTATCSTEVIPSAWAKEFMTADSRFYEGLLSPEAREKVLSAARIQTPNFAVPGRSQLDHVREGKLFVDRRGPLQSLDQVNWSTLDHGKYYATQLHGLVGLGGLLTMNERLPDAVSKAVSEHIKQWTLCVASNPEINPRAWYEGTVVKRLSNLLHALNYFRQWGDLGDLKYDELIYLIDINATYLLDTPDVYSFGNHGIRQDTLLAATALTLPTHPRAEEMTRVAEQRLDNAAEGLFTESGIWKEHATGYVNYVIRLMEDVRVLHDASENFNPDSFLGRAETSLQFLLTSLMPDQRIPHVGWSNARNVRSNSWLDFDIESFLASKARTLSSFPDYGHAVVRGDHPNGLYLLLVAAQNLPAGKRHADDLSFLLSNHGRIWITEGGHKTYERVPITAYLISSYAHNTYMLNGQGFPGNVAPALDTELTGADQDGEKITLAGYTERFHNPARFERQIEIDDFSQIKIRDRLRSEKKLALWEGRFHFPGDLETTVDNNTVLVSAPDGETMTLRFQSDADLALSTCHGQEAPLCGWGKTDGKHGPVTTLMWSLEGDADIEIAIEWNNGNNPDSALN